VKTRQRFGSKTASFHVSLFLYHFFISHCQYYLYVACIISFDRLIRLTSMITRTISYDISDRAPFVFSWSEYLPASFHVLVVHCCWRRLSSVHLWQWLDSIYWLAGLVHIWG